MRRITIGRAPGNTIRIDERWDMVSNDHADIVREGNTYTLYDHSTNGTKVDGVKVNLTHKTIYPGQRIVLAGQFELTWDVIKAYLPDEQAQSGYESNVGRGTVKYHEDAGQSGAQESGGHKTEFIGNRQQPGGNTNLYGQDGRQTVRVAENYGQANEYSQAEIDKALGKWNWGAFFCTWLWGVCHKMYWPLLIIIVGAIPYVGQVCSIVLCVYLGMKGSRIAWDSGRYKDFDAYKRAQHRWAIGGVIWFLLSLAYSAYCVYTILSMV